MAKIELTHDIIAQEIYKNSSEAHQIRREMESRVRVRYIDYREQQIPLSTEEMNVIAPYLDIIRISEAEREFLKDSQDRIDLETAKAVRRRNMVRNILIVSSLLFAGLAIWALSERNRADSQRQKSHAMRLALTSRYALFEGDPSLAWRLAEEAIIIGTDSDSMVNKVTIEVFTEIARYPLVQDFVHHDTITEVHFSHKGDRLLTASLDKDVKIWNLEGEELNNLLHDAGVTKAIFSPNDSLIATATTSHAIYLWDENGNLITQLKHKGGITDLQFSRDNQYLLTASTDQTAMLWNLESNELITTFTHENAVTGARFLYEANVSVPSIVTASLDSTGIRWDLDGNRMLSYPALFYNEDENRLIKEPLTGLEIAPAGNRIIFHSSNGDFIISPEGESLEDPVSLYFLSVQPRRSEFSPVMLPERASVISRDSTKVMVWNFTEAGVDFQHTPIGHVLHATFSQDGEKLVSSSSDNETVVFQAFYDDSGGEKVFDQFDDQFRFNGRISMGEYAPAGDYFLSAKEGTTATLWRFDNDFVEAKKQWGLDSLHRYYSPRLRQLTPAEITSNGLED